MMNVYHPNFDLRDEHNIAYPHGILRRQGILEDCSLYLRFHKSVFNTSSTSRAQRKAAFWKEGLVQFECALYRGSRYILLILKSYEMWYKMFHYKRLFHYIPLHVPETAIL